MTEAALAAARADVVIACIGEETYTEKPGDIDDLALARGQTEASGVGWVGWRYIDRCFNVI